MPDKCGNKYCAYYDNTPEGTRTYMMGFAKIAQNPLRKDVKEKRFSCPFLAWKEKLPLGNVRKKKEMIT